MKPAIRPYQAADFAAVYHLWEASLGALWPLAPEFLASLMDDFRYREGDHLVVTHNGQIIGFAATRMDSATDASIPLLMVHPNQQRQGIGTQLQAAAVEQLHGKGTQQISLGHGPLWPGVPHNCPGAVDFFRACGWQLLDTHYDLVQDLTTYQTPAGILERVITQNIEIRSAAADDIAAILEFEQRVFPSWLEYFRGTADDGRCADILAAWHEGTVVGSLLCETAPPHWHHLLLGQDMGSIGAVGVDETYQRRGIGLALVARASEIMRARGVRQCMIGWTDLLNFYGKLGYVVWRTYAMTDEP